MIWTIFILRIILKVPRMVHNLLIAAKKSVLQVIPLYQAVHPDIPISLLSLVSEICIFK